MNEAKRNLRGVGRFRTMLLAALVTTGSLAHAEDAYPTDLFLRLGESIVSDSLRGASLKYSPIDTHYSERIRLPEPQPSVVAFIKDCAELDAVPIIELSGQKDRRVFLGVNFDGIFGIHARM